MKIRQRQAATTTEKETGIPMSLKLAGIVFPILAGVCGGVWTLSKTYIDYQKELAKEAKETAKLKLETERELTLRQKQTNGFQVAMSEQKTRQEEAEAKQKGADARAEQARAAAQISRDTLANLKEVTGAISTLAQKKSGDSGDASAFLILGLHAKEPEFRTAILRALRSAWRVP